MDLYLILVCFNNLRNGQFTVVQKNDDDDFLVSSSDTHTHVIHRGIEKHCLVFLALHENVAQLLKVLHDFIFVDVVDIFELGLGVDDLELLVAFVIIHQRGDLAGIVLITLEV